MNLTRSAFSFCSQTLVTAYGPISGFSSSEKRDRGTLLHLTLEDPDNSKWKCLVSHKSLIIKLDIYRCLSF